MGGWLALPNLALPRQLLVDQEADCDIVYLSEYSMALEKVCRKAEASETCMNKDQVCWSWQSACHLCRAAHRTLTVFCKSFAVLLPVCV